MKLETTRPEDLTASIWIGGIALALSIFNTVMLIALIVQIV